MKSNYNFHEIIERRNTNSEKWDRCDFLFRGENLLPMWVADMDFQAPAEVIKALKKVSGHGIIGYSAYSDDTYRAVQNWFCRKYSWEIKKEWICFSPGVVAGISFLIQALTEKGEGIVIQPPVYYPFSKLIEGHERITTENPLMEIDGRYVMNFYELEKICSEENTKMLITSSPHNPGGRVWNSDELSRIVEICRKYDIFLVSDEIHCDLTLGESKQIPIDTLSNGYDKLMTCTSPSKTFNIAGCKISNIIIRDSSIREKFNNMVLKNGCADPNPFGIAAMEAAYNHGDTWLSELKVYLENNLKIIRDTLKNELPEVKLMEPQATYLAWLDFRGTGIPYQKQDKIFTDKAKLAPDPGHIFGTGGEGFQRINFACPETTLREGLDRMIRAFKG